MQVLEQGKGPDRLAKSGSCRGSDCEKEFDIEMDGKPSRCLSQHPPSVLETLFFPFCLDSVEHYEVEHYGAYLGHLLYFRSQVHEILGAGDKNFPWTF